VVRGIKKKTGPSIEDNLHFPSSLQLKKDWGFCSFSLEINTYIHTYTPTYIHTYIHKLASSSGPEFKPHFHTHTKTKPFYLPGFTFISPVPIVSVFVSILGCVVQMVEHLPSKSETPSSNPTTTPPEK
jgi:hypothetical protein